MEWKTYFKKHEKRKPREQTVRAISYCKNKRTALDLGSGNFIESKFLARIFKHVVAVDGSADTNLYNKKLSTNIEFLNQPFKDT